MNKKSIFSDGTADYIIPSEPRPGDTVIIRIRTAKERNLIVTLITGDSRLACWKESESGDGQFDYYRTKLVVTEDVLFYYFELKHGNELCYYDRFGPADDIRFQYRFTIYPGFTTPDWAKGAVMYQILVDRFCDGNPANDVLDHEYHYITTYSHKVADWNQPPDTFDVANFYGGDLEGVRQKLYYLKNLGVEAIYFNPIFVSPSNHKYDCQDYDHIDPHYAGIKHDGGELLQDGDYDNRHATKYIIRTTSQENLSAADSKFASFVADAHKMGMKVILDGVFNHCGSFNKWMDREGIYEGQEGYAPGAYKKKDSPYHDFFRFFSNNDSDWPDNKSYDGWWGNDTLPKLNYEGSQELEDYIIRIGKKWVSPPFNCDGWRLDVAADLGHSEEYNHKFWQRFRREVKASNPNAVILAEHYGDASAWLNGKEWDTIMNYDGFMEPVSYFLTGMEKHSDRFEQDALGDGRRFEITMRHEMAIMPVPTLYCAMNELSNHDHSRFMTRTNHKVGRVSDLGSQAAGEDVNPAVFKLGAMIQMTWPGAATIYYGDEAGTVGFTDPDSRRTYPWGHEDRDLIDYYRDLAYLRRFHEPLRTGSIMFLSCGTNLVSYARFNEKEKLVIAINVGGSDMEDDIEVWKAGIPKNCTVISVFDTMENGYSIMPVEYDVKDGWLHIKLYKYGGIVLQYES